ncbi:MAG: cell division protein ZapE, partial [Burkholderiales bacterium]|nr:cell division protein ZapE [Burkholderiales bacterium]
MNDRAAPDALAAAFDARAAELGFTLDATQRAAIAHFARLDADLIRVARAEASWTRLLKGAPPAPRSLYLWGGVGRGKSFLMDTWFDRAPVARRRRVHFHRFMQEIHARLRALQGETDPLKRVARDVADDARLLCLDEFQVTDIGDAMLMAGLLDGLVATRVTVVTTSNTPPSRLYEHGLQRDNFLPAIRLIERNFDIVELDHGVDYRQRLLEKAATWKTPPGPDADAALAEIFAGLAGETGGRARFDAPGADGDAASMVDPDARTWADPRPVRGRTIRIEGRPIAVRQLAPGVAWFDFDALCDGPRAQADYIELARHFHTVLISRVPRFDGPADANRMRRFTWLVDEFYDRRVKLVVSA